MPDSAAMPQPDADTTNWLEYLKRFPIWMCAPAQGGKNPLDARTGKAGSPTYPAHWDTYEVAAATAQRLGLLVGVALGPLPGSDFSLVAVDIDKAQSEGKVKPYAQKMVDITESWLYEVSRSKQGLHGYALVRTADIGEIENRRPPKKDGMGLEFYLRDRYFIWTGEPLKSGARTTLPTIEAAELAPIVALMDEFEAIKEDIYLAAFQRQDMVLSRGKKGRINIKCPWIEGHTTKGDDTETAYWPPQDGKPPGFKCQHVHCDGKGMKAVVTWLKKKDEKFVEDLAEFGKERRMKGIAGPEFYEAMLAQIFVEEYGKDYRYNHNREQWLKWSGTHWAAEETKEVVEIIKKIATAHGAPSKSGTKGSQVFTAERLMRSDRAVAMTNDKFDANPDLFNHLGGTLNTVTMETHPHRREDYLTKCAAAKPEGDCPTWDAFIARIMADDADMLAYLQRLTGSTLTGEVKDKKFFELWGDGDNGKTVFIEMWGKVLGDYADAVDPSLFVMTKHEPHPTARADLAGLRLAYTSELEAGQTWNTELIKRITGGDTIRARRMREDFWKFKAQCKLVIAGNHKLNLRRVGKAIKTRLHLIPFTVSIPEAEQNKDLPVELWRERDGILARMVEGLRDWRRVGLVPPKQVLDATDDYFKEQDTIGNWMAEECEEGKQYEEDGKKLYQSYRQWCERNNEYVPSNKAFSQMLTDAKFTSRKSHGKVCWKGLKLKPRPVDEQPWPPGEQSPPGGDVEVPF